MQIASRILLVWGVTYPFPQLAASPAYSSMLLAWSVTEVIRYTYFGLNTAGSPPPDLLVWLRYNTFYVLYPMGILSEVWLICLATGPAGEVWFGFELALYAILAIYVPGEYFFGDKYRGEGGANGYRVVCPLHTHDEAEEEGHEEAEGGRGEEGPVSWGCGGWWSGRTGEGVMRTLCPGVAILILVLSSRMTLLSGPEGSPTPCLPVPL